MAEHAAHVTATSLSLRPSIFEILAQDGLNRIIQPAVKHASRILAEENPEKYGWLLKYFDEIYAGMDFLVENYYLYKYAGSFSENFYGLQRVGPLPTQQLTRSVYLKSIFFLVAFPYIREKWRKSYEQYRESTFRLEDPSAIQIHPLKKICLSLFPYMNSFWEMLVLFFELSYIFHRSDWATPGLYFAGARLNTISSEVGFFPSKRDLPSINLLGPILFSSSLPRQIGQLCLQLLNFISFGLSTGLSIGVFFLQFLDYWYNTLQSNNSPIAATMQPIPQKPQPYLLPPGCSFSTCPLCMKTRTNHTVLSVSGFVFCYPCIFDHVNNHHCCPVTKYPANLQQLVRIFASES